MWAREDRAACLMGSMKGHCTACLHWTEMQNRQGGSGWDVSKLEFVYMYLCTLQAIGLQGHFVSHWRDFFVRRLGPLRSALWAQTSSRAATFESGWAKIAEC